MWKNCANRRRINAIYPYNPEGKINVNAGDITGTNHHKFWNEKIVTLANFSSLGALEVVIMTTFNASSDEKIANVTTFPFQYRTCGGWSCVIDSYWIYLMDIHKGCQNVVSTQQLVFNQGKTSKLLAPSVRIASGHNANFVVPGGTGYIVMTNPGVATDDKIVTMTTCNIQYHTDNSWYSEAILFERDYVDSLLLTGEVEVWVSVVLPFSPYYSLSLIEKCVVLYYSTGVQIVSCTFSSDSVLIILPLHLVTSTGFWRRNWSIIQNMTFEYDYLNKNVNLYHCFAGKSKLNVVSTSQ